ncbi:MAG: primosomal protein N' (replication factor Y) - superfamily II helicase [Rhodobacteraceae bacterium]|nr:primosomal protein N' (replication factor Y) - superfamily II helicase [Paracoccaceae bacterium]
MAPETVAAPGETQHRFPCPSCGADLRYDPTGQQLKCDHCGHETAIGAQGPWGAAASVREMDFRAALDATPGAVDYEETRVLTCPSCGAQVEVDERIHAQVCPFCATPVVTETGRNRHIRPHGVLPFALGEAAARDAMGRWLGRLWFAPSGLQEFARRGRRMDGIYTPYWTFDADTRSHYAGERGTVYYTTRTVMRNGKPETVQVANIRWRPVQGQVKRFFDDVLVLASRSLPDRFTAALPPWDLSRLVPYAAEYLAGFRAEAYTVEIGDGFHEARAQMDRIIERDVRFDIGGDHQRIHRIDTDVANVTFKHVLLPIWVAAYRYRGQAYRVVINGQTGRVQGERPWSALKIAAAVLLGLLVAGGVGYWVALNQDSLSTIRTY